MINTESVTDSFVEWKINDQKVVETVLFIKTGIVNL